MVASATVTDATCNGGNDGSAELTVLGGTAPYDMEDLSGLSAGTYSTTVVDANGCETSVEFVVDEPAILIIDSFVISDFNGFGVSCFGDDNGFIDVTVLGGVGPYISVSYTHLTLPTKA